MRDSTGQNQTQKQLSERRDKYTEWSKSRCSMQDRQIARYCPGKHWPCSPRLFRPSSQQLPQQSTSRPRRCVELNCRFLFLRSKTEATAMHRLFILSKIPTMHTTVLLFWFFFVSYSGIYLFSFNANFPTSELKHPFREVCSHAFAKRISRIDINSA